MEKRQLDFNAPLLSVRRYSSPSRSTELVARKVLEKPLSGTQQSVPSVKSDWENEEVTKPAAVPFHWEHIPGRPKGEVDTQAHTPEEPSNTPRLPPARVSGPIRRYSGETPKLPPGRVSAGPSRYNSGERPNDHNIYRPQVESFSFNDHAILLEKLNESLNCKDESDSESGDDAYSDALDVLSLTESRSLNYSVSGISGCNSAGVKPSGTFCIDKQTRDFMMDRFLPAAKAVVIETPHVVKKPQVHNELPKQERKVVSGELKASLKQYSSDALPYYSQYVNNVESEDEELESSVPVKKPGKAWGILPRFCVKNSLCLLNPLPALKLRARTPSTPPTSLTPRTPPVGEVRRLTRNAHSGPLNKNAYHVPQKKKFHSGLLSRDLPGLEDKLSHDSTLFPDTHDSLKSGASPLRHYRSGNISPYRNESPKSPFREGVGFLGVPKEVEKQNASKIASSRKMFKALQDVSRNQINERKSSGPTSDAVEKTLYVDFVNKTELPTVKSSSTKADGIVSFSGEKSKVLAGSRRTDGMSAVKSHRDTSGPNISKERKNHPSRKLRSTDKVLPSTCAPKVGHAADVEEDIKLNQECRNLECIEVPCDVKLRTKEEGYLESDNRRESDPPAKSPLPPPLPKSPSESWLWRTLPSISLGNPFAHSRQKSQLSSKKQGQKGSATDTKWETIVKTSNLRPDHIRYSEELIPHTSHRQSKS